LVRRDALPDHLPIITGENSYDDYISMREEEIAAVVLIVVQNPKNPKTPFYFNQSSIPIVSQLKSESKLFHD
jgi:hypothetical protein